MVTLLFNTKIALPAVRSGDGAAIDDYPCKWLSVGWASVQVGSAKPIEGVSKCFLLVQMVKCLCLMMIYLWAFL